MIPRSLLVMVLRRDLGSVIRALWISPDIDPGVDTTSYQIACNCIAYELIPSYEFVVEAMRSVH